MDPSGVKLRPMPVFLQVYVERHDNSYHTVHATPDDAGRIAVDEAKKPDTRLVVLRKMRVEGYDG